MLTVGWQRQRFYNRPTRRAFLEIGGRTALGLTMAGWLDGKAAASDQAAGCARSVLLLWLWGGPSHLDTWDPKPGAPLEFRGPFCPIATTIPGVRICELFPKLARISNLYAIIRSLHTGSNDHGVAGTIGLTGSAAGGVGLDGKPLPGAARPASGSVIARLQGRRRSLPPFMVVGGRLHQGKKAIVGEGGAGLGASYDPFRVECDPGRAIHLPALRLAPDITFERLDNRARLVEAFDELRRSEDKGSAEHASGALRRRALAMLTSPSSRRAFDLGEEPSTVRDRYGRTRFGQSCLLGRRLVEQRVPFVQVNWSDHVEAEEDSGDGGWDHHYRNFQIMQDRHGPWLDQALSALLTDLDQRGLLDSTLVLVMGEFGRTPKVNDKAGRDHWEHCYSAMVAGGGVRGGRVIGASDSKGCHPHDNPATPADVAASVYQAVGFRSEQLAALGLGATGKVIDELF